MVIKENYNLNLIGFKLRDVLVDCGELSLYDEAVNRIDKIYFSIGLLVEKS